MTNPTNHERTSILQKLEGDRVFDIQKLADGRFELVEGCDSYFNCKLTAQELYELGAELQELSGAMQPAQPSVDAVECAREIVNVLGYSVHAGWKDEFISKTAQQVQQHTDARVAELTQRNAELERALRSLHGYIATVNPDAYGCSKAMMTAESVLASQGGNGGR